MKNVLNSIILVLKFITYFVALALTLYIILFMYKRIEKNIINSVYIFIPYFILLAMFIINIYLKQKQVSNNIFYNITCTLVFSITIIVALRAIYDKNMVLNSIMGYNINFNYFSDYISFMNIMMYGLILANILFMLSKSNKKIAKKIDLEVL